uniref:RDD domain-containing protein n=1 Tax=Biomphalaria glabrata TaxID=6526 RepID=A0A2C9LKG6_BIOGL
MASYTSPNDTNKETHKCKNIVDQHQCHQEVNVDEANHNHCCHEFKYKNAQQYAQSLRPWLWQYQNACVMHQFLATSFIIQAQAFPHFIPFSGGNNDPLTNNQLQNRLDPTGTGIAGVQNRNSVYYTNNIQTEPQQQLQEKDIYHMFRKRHIPYVQKKTKSCVHLVFLFSFLNTEDLMDFEMDYERAFAITFDVIVLEILNRILITIFETLCLYRPQLRPGGAGATPGKRLLGLKVVSCDQVQSLGHGQVMVSPAGPLSFKSALLRSVVKNFTIAFFLPVCLTLFFFKHNQRWNYLLAFPSTYVMINSSSNIVI